MKKSSQNVDRATIGIQHFYHYRDVEKSLGRGFEFVSYDSIKDVRIYCSLSQAWSKKI